MKKKKIISAVSTVALTVSSLVPLSANAYEIVYREEIGRGSTICFIKQNENDNLGRAPALIEGDTGFRNNIKFTTKDGSILTEKDLPEILKNGQQFHVEYDNGVHTIVFEGDHPFLFGASERARRCARGLTLRKNIENVELTSGKYRQYASDWIGGLEQTDSNTQKEYFTFSLKIPCESTYVPATKDFSVLDVCSVNFSYTDNGYNYYNLNVYIDSELTKKFEENKKNIYLISNNYVDTYIKLKEIQNQSNSTFVVNSNLVYLGADYGGLPSKTEIGDFNLDDKIDVKDFFTLSQFIAEVDKETINADQADVNRDGVADVSDLLAIAQYIVK